MQTMQEETVMEIIRYFGSITKMAKKIDVPRSSIYRYLDGQNIPESIAKRIEFKSLGKFRYKSLISTKSKCYSELNNFPGDLVKLSLEEICISTQIPSFPDQNGLLIPNQ